MKLFIPAFLLMSAVSFAQSGYNYYKRADRVGSKNEKAFTYFKKAYYEHIWNWTKTGSDSAVHYLQLAIKEDSLYGAAYAFLGHVYKFKTYDASDKGEFRNQKWYAEKAITLSPGLGDAYTLMATVKWTEGDKTSALNYLREAVRIEPDHVGNYIWLGMRLGIFPDKKDSAVQVYHQIIRMDPEYGQAYMKLAVLYEDYRVYDSALLYLNKAIAHYENVKPRDLRMINGYLYSAIMLKDHYKNYELAERNLKIFLKELEGTDFMVKEQAHMLAYAALADCYKKMAEQNIQLLIDHNEKFLDENPNDFQRTAQVVDSYMALGSDSIIVKYVLPLSRRLKDAATTDDEKNLALLIHIDALERSNNLAGAIHEVTEYSAKHPTNFYALVEGGRLHAKNGDTRQAIAFLNKARKNVKTDEDRMMLKTRLSEKDFDGLRENKDFQKLL